MVTKSGVIDALLVTIGIFLLLQVIGGITGLFDISRRDPSGFAAMFGLIFSLISGGIGILILRQVHKRRKNRQAKSAEKTRLEQATPIGIQVVGIQKQRDRPLGITLIPLFDLIGGIGTIPVGAYIIQVPTNEIFPISSDLARIYGVAIVLSGIFSVISGYGLFRRKQWGWRLSLIGVYYSFAWSIGSTIWPFAPVSVAAETYSTYVSWVIAITIPVVILYYLNRPHVREHFGIETHRYF